MVQANQTLHKSVMHTVRMSGHKVCMRVLFGKFSRSDIDLHLVGVGLGEDQTTHNVRTHTCFKEIGLRLRIL